jgi:hypothetical protein
MANVEFADHVPPASWSWRASYMLDTVGLMNQLMAANTTGTSGVDWSQATKIRETLLISPLAARNLSLPWARWRLHFSAGRALPVAREGSSKTCRYRRKTRKS